MSLKMYRDALGLEAPMIAASGRVRSIVRILLHELPGFGQDQVTPNPFEQLIAETDFSSFRS